VASSSIDNARGYVEALKLRGREDVILHIRASSYRVCQLHSGLIDRRFPRRVSLSTSSNGRPDPIATMAALLSNSVDLRSVQTTQIPCPSPMRKVRMRQPCWRATLRAAERYSATVHESVVALPGDRPAYGGR